MWLLNLFIYCFFYIYLFMYVRFSVRDLDAKGIVSRNLLSPLSLVRNEKLCPLGPW